MQPHRRQPTRLPCPWDSPGKNTGVGCHFLFQCIKVKVKSLSRAQLLATPWTAAHQAPPSMGFSRHEGRSGVPSPSPKVAQSCPTLCNSMDYTAHGILQARILEWVAFPFSRGYFQPRARTQVSCIARQILYQLSQKGRQTQKPFRLHLITSRWKRISQKKNKSTTT